jgi:predicted phosphodiesterase
MTRKQAKGLTDRILFVPDLHLPFQHPESFAFLKWLKQRIKPTLVICIGDLLDQQGLSFFEKNPDLPGALDELHQGKQAMQTLFRLFPDMLIVRGNHDYRPTRAANRAGLPTEYLKPEPDLFGSPVGWEFRNDLYLTLPTGDHLYVAHDVGRSLKKAAAQRAMCVVQGHYHSKMKITYVSNHYSLNFGMNVGCLVHQDHPAFNYMKNSSKILTRERNILGTGLILNGQPMLIPMHLKNGKWVKSLSEKLLSGVTK